MNAFRRIAFRLWDSPTAATWARMATHLGAVAILLPFVLRAFPTEAIAVYLLFATVSSLQALFTLGFTPTFARFFAYGRAGATVSAIKGMQQGSRDSPPPTAEDGPNRETIARVAASGSRIYAWLAVAALVLLATGGSALVARPINALPNPSEGWAAWFAVGSVISFNTGMAFYYALLTGLGHVAQAGRREAVAGAGGIVTALAVLLLNGGLLEVVLARYAWLAAGRLALFRAARQSEPAAARAAAAPTDPTLNRVAWRSAWRSATGMLGGNAIGHGLGAFYSAAASSAELASFLLSFRLVQAIASLSQAPFYSRLPELNRLYAAGERQCFADCATRRVGFALWTFALPAAALFVVGDYALDRLAANAKLASPPILSALAFAFFTERYCGMLLQIHTATNQVLWHWHALAYGCAVFAVIVPLYRSFGAFGLAAALLLARLIASLPFTVALLHKTVGRDGRRVHAAAAGPAAALGLAAITLLYGL